MLMCQNKQGLQHSSVTEKTGGCGQVILAVWGHALEAIPVVER